MKSENTVRQTLLLIMLISAWPHPCSAADPLTVAQSINSYFDTELKSREVVAAPMVDDATFLRRISLDLIGRIPTPAEIVTFCDDQNPDKRTAIVERLLHDPEHAGHFARTWRGLLVPESETDRQLEYFVPGFEAWLREQRQARVGFDQLVRELLSVPINGTRERPQLVLKDLKAANPVAFIAAKNADAAALASATSRLFLGIRLECAQCHDHPFDQWTQHQFWNQAAFFAGIERRGKGAFAPVLEVRDRREVAVMGTDTTVPALFLNGTDPVFHDDLPPRVELANWITSPENPFFARAVANRIWGELTGTGLVDPVDDMHASNPPSHPDVLDQLAAGFQQSGFDLDFLYRAICLSDVYQRSSMVTHPSQNDPTLFARRAIKPMTGEQFYDSLQLAIGTDSSADKSKRRRDGERRRIIDLFDPHGASRDPETSVIQALTLMNGSVVNRAASLSSGHRLKALQADTTLEDRARLDQLYLATLSRFPTTTERELLLSQFSSSEEADRSRHWEDIFWMLLNSAEFRWNH